MGLAFVQISANFISLSIACKMYFHTKFVSTKTSLT